MRWYELLIKKIEDAGNDIFIYDLECLFNDRNFYKDLSQKYDIFKYETDGDYYQFKNSKSSKSKLIYSNKYVMRSFTENALKILAK